MDGCLLVRLARSLKLLKQFEQTGQVAIPGANWIHFFEALTFLNRAGSRREIHCAFTGERLLLSRAPLERTEDEEEPTQGELFER
jgi:hypothetical protein